MKYVIALLASAAAIFFWALLSVAVGWERGGGIIGMLFMWAIVAGIWRTIMSRFPNESTSRGPCSPTDTSSSSNNCDSGRPSHVLQQDKYELLAKLKKMKDSDILTDDEYVREKRKILNSR